VLSGRGFRVGLITRPEESYRERVCHGPLGGCCTVVKIIFIKRNVFLITHLFIYLMIMSVDTLYLQIR